MFNPVRLARRITSTKYASYTATCARSSQRSEAFSHMKPAADQEESKAKIDGGTTSAKSGAAFLGFAYDLPRVEPRDRDVEPQRAVPLEPSQPQQATPSELPQPQQATAPEPSQPRQATLLELSQLQQAAPLEPLLSFNLPPLPELPDKPKYPCPYLTDAEITTYLVPLYKRGWTVQSSNKAARQGHPSVAPALVKRFIFLKERGYANLQFTEDIERFQKDEDVSGVPHPPKVRPGITLRDVRLAILAERAFEAHLVRGKGDPRAMRADTRPAMCPLTMQDVEERRLSYDAIRHRQGCPVCGSKKHLKGECPKQYEVKPRRLCVHCGEMHWDFQCPQEKKELESDAGPSSAI
ncbi:predicted protein [Postia placenta Mad-698-R]|nr:predicted protein [Postia placenta Mad-698-R]